MNIIFTKKWVALIIIAIMLLGISTPVFATVSDLEFMELKDIGIEDQGFEEVTEESGAELPVYDKEGNIVKVLQAGMKIHILALESGYINSIIEQKEPNNAWIKIELEDGTIGFLNLMDEPIEELEKPAEPEKEPEVEPEKPAEPEVEPEVQPEKEPEAPAEPEKEPEKEPEMPAEPEKDNEFNFIDNILGNSFITEMKNMFKDTLSKVFENSEIFKNLNFSDEEKELVEEVESDFKDFVLKFSKVTLQISRRVLSDISKTFFDKIGKLDKEEQLPENNEEQKPDDNEEQLPENNEEQKPDDNEEQLPENNEEQKPDDNEEQLPENNEEQKPDDNEEQLPENNEEQKPDDNEEQKPDDNEEQLPENNEEQKPDDNEEQKPDDNEEQLPENNEEQQPDDNEEQLPENNEEQQPDDNEEQQPETTQKTDFLNSIITTILPNSGKLTDIMKNVGELMKPIQNVVGSIFGTSSGLTDGLSGITNIITNVVGNIKLPFLNIF